VADHKEDGEESNEAYTEHHFEIGSIEYRNGASVFASLSGAIQQRSPFSTRIGIREGFRSAPNGGSSTSGHFRRIRDSCYRMLRVLEFKWRECYGTTR